MFRIYALAIASFAVAAVGVVTLERTAARAEWNAAARVTSAPAGEETPLADHFFHVQWTAVARPRGGSEITGYVYNDYGDPAVNVQLRIAELDAPGQEVAYAIRPVVGAVPGYGRAYFDARVPARPSYRVTVVSFAFLESKGVS